MHINLAKDKKIIDYLMKNGSKLISSNIIIDEDSKVGCYFFLKLLAKNTNNKPQTAMKKFTNIRDNFV